MKVTVHKQFEFRGFEIACLPQYIIKLFVKQAFRE